MVERESERGEKEKEKAKWARERVELGIGKVIGYCNCCLCGYNAMPSQIYEKISFEENNVGLFCLVVLLYAPISFLCVLPYKKILHLKRIQES